jgi:hypothetical protein
LFPAPALPVVLDVRGPGEWIVSSPEGGAALHVYRLPAGDWLVSEVGRRSEGRGADLRQALAALAGDSTPPDWWGVAAEALGEVPAPRQSSR